MPETGSNVAIAFGLVIGAGAATALGAAIVFVPWLVQYANRKTLASALGFSAGVMTYVSFVEILQKSTRSFMASGLSYNDSYKYSTCCFFAGVFIMVMLNYTVSLLLKGEHHHNHHHHDHFAPDDRRKNSTDIMRTSSCDKDDGHSEEEKTSVDDANVSPCPCCSDDPAKDLERIKDMAAKLEKVDKGEDSCGGVQDNELKSDKSNDESDDAEKGDIAAAKVAQEKENKKIMSMSINTAVAIALHNFPEGLATFVAALNDPKVGAVLAVAIAIHNIPEGICVALPVYYATGSRCKAFGWALLSGISEPIAALLGWAVLSSVFSDKTYAILFGGVAGMMVIISIRELLPTAHRYDPEDSVVTYSFMAGMVLMAFSLVLFLL